VGFGGTGGGGSGYIGGVDGLLDSAAATTAGQRDGNGQVVVKAYDFGTVARVVAADKVVKHDGTPQGIDAPIVEARDVLTDAPVLDPLVVITYTGIGGTTYGPSTTPPTDVGVYRAAVTLPACAIQQPSVTEATLTILAGAYTVTFADGRGGASMPPALFIAGVATNLPPSTYARNGWTQAGWTNAVSGGAALANEAPLDGDFAAADETVALTAVWSPVGPLEQWVRVEAIYAPTDGGDVTLAWPQAAVDAVTGDYHYVLYATGDLAAPLASWSRLFETNALHAARFSRDAGLHRATYGAGPERQFFRVKAVKE
jgi:hypothetical protein